MSVEITQKYEWGRNLIYDADDNTIVDSDSGQKIYRAYSDLER